LISDDNDKSAAVPIEAPWMRRGSNGYWFRLKGDENDKRPLEVEEPMEDDGRSSKHMRIDAAMKRRCADVR
jgi:hypothetical protein